MTTTLVLEQSARTVITEAGGTTLVQETPSTATQVQTQSGQGPAGAGAYQTALLLGFEGDEAAWLASLHGADGDDGASAYELALAEGFVGSQSAWVASLAGADGDDGASAYAIALANGFSGRSRHGSRRSRARLARLAPMEMTGRAPTLSLSRTASRAAKRHGCSRWKAPMAPMGTTAQTA